MQKRQLARMLAALAAAAAAFFVPAAALHWNLLVCMALGIGIYLAVWLLTSPAPGSREAYLDARGDAADLAAMLEEAAHDLHEVRLSAQRIRDRQMQQEALHLAATGEKILAYLREHPQKIMPARRFLTYFIDTTGKIVRQYVKFQQSGLETQQVLAFQEKARALLPKLDDAFDRQFAHLMEDERFDVEADMTVIENMLQSEGV